MRIAVLSDLHVHRDRSPVDPGLQLPLCLEGAQTLTIDHRTTNTEHRLGLADVHPHHSFDIHVGKLPGRTSEPPAFSVMNCVAFQTSSMSWLSRRGR